jgi:hypothetical protein
MRGGNTCRMRPTFGGSDTRLACKGPEPKKSQDQYPSARKKRAGSTNSEARKMVARKDKTSGRALPEVSEVYQKAAKEFHWLPCRHIRLCNYMSKSYFLIF